MSEMNGPGFDEMLAQAMQRVDAPEGFAAKVMECAVQPRAKLLLMPRIPAWMSGAIAATVFMGLVAGGALHLEHEREQARATAEFELSMQITNQALEQTRHQLARAGISLDQQ